MFPRSNNVIVSIIHSVSRLKTRDWIDFFKPNQLGLDFPIKQEMEELEMSKSLLDYQCSEGIVKVSMLISNKKLGCCRETFDCESALRQELNK